jgi:hypothetical protein
MCVLYHVGIPLFFMPLKDFLENRKCLFWILVQIRDYISRMWNKIDTVLTALYSEGQKEKMFALGINNMPLKCMGAMKV